MQAKAKPGHPNKKTGGKLAPASARVAQVGTEGAGPGSNGAPGPWAGTLQPSGALRVRRLDSHHQNALLLVLKAQGLCEMPYCNLHFTFCSFSQPESKLYLQRPANCEN